MGEEVIHHLIRRDETVSLMGVREAWWRQIDKVIIKSDSFYT
jgi:hypothetical protein